MENQGRKIKRWIPEVIELKESKKMYPHATLWHTRKRMKKMRMFLIPDNKNIGLITNGITHDIIQQTVHEISELTIFMVALQMIYEEKKIPWKQAADLANPDLSMLFPKLSKAKQSEFFTLIDFMLLPEYLMLVEK